MILQVHKKQLDLLNFEEKVKEATSRKIELETEQQKEKHTQVLNTLEDFRAWKFCNKLYQHDCDR